MRRSVIYDILKDGDRHLRGKIAELVFKRVKSQLLKRPCCCNTMELTYFLMHYAHFKENISFLLGGESKSYSFGPLIGVPMEEEGETSVNILSEEDIRKLMKFCLFCLKEGEKEVGIQIDDKCILFYLCDECLGRCVNRGVVCSTNFTYKVNPNTEAFEELRRFLAKIYRYITIVAVLSKLDPAARIFLYEVYKVWRSQYPFDYVCVDEDGNKYLVDVTSIRQENEKPAKLSERENQIAIS